MVTLVTQRDVRRAQVLPFCYLCGKSFASRRDNHPDHIPPECIFDKADRNFPLKVASHESCNQRNSISDAVAGQLIAVIHGRYDQHVLLDLCEVFDENTGSVSVGVRNSAIREQIARWVRGFHAALYQAYLPESVFVNSYLPFPSVAARANGSLVVEPPCSHQRELVTVIKATRAAKTTDFISCNNSKLTYECTWGRSSSGAWVCAFALQIYDWKRLASNDYPSRGCVGCYMQSSKPIAAAAATELAFSVENVSQLDPFGT